MEQREIGKRTKLIDVQIYCWNGENVKETYKTNFLEVKGLVVYITNEGTILLCDIIMELWMQAQFQVEGEQFYVNAHQGGTFNPLSTKPSEQIEIKSGCIILVPNQQPPAITVTKDLRPKGATFSKEKEIPASSISITVPDQSIDPELNILPIPEDIDVESMEDVTANYAKIDNDPNEDIKSPAENDEKVKKPRKNSGGGRGKEKTISFAVYKHDEWRILHDFGTTDKFGHVSKLDFETAAKRVEVNKKTLDDYHYYIEYGKKFGFKFLDNAGMKIGVLKSFVRDHLPPKKKS